MPSLPTSSFEQNFGRWDINDHGGFICCMLDITCEKGAELVEREAAKNAIEARMRQERFIDMISHEIRNPLSAMLHCTEDIDEAVSDPEDFDISSIKEAIETINVCIQVGAPDTL
jgi:signal transduction histidine kinase